MKVLQDRTAIITGGTTDGIGRATAALFAAHGARVAIFDIEATDPAAADVGAGHLSYVCGVRDQAACTTTVDEIAERFGRIDVPIERPAVNLYDRWSYAIHQRSTNLRPSTSQLPHIGPCWILSAIAKT